MIYTRRSIFNHELTKEEWENRDEWLLFNNEDLPADDATLNTVYTEIISRLREQSNITEAAE